jgi:ABC-type branched-subunit amino acid transport system ATPase component
VHNFCDAIADKAYVLENGTIALSGPAEELTEDAQLKKSCPGI